MLEGSSYPAVTLDMIDKTCMIFIKMIKLNKQKIIIHNYYINNELNTLILDFVL